MNLAPSALIDELRPHRGRLLTAGIAIVILGLVALALQVATTLASVVILGAIVAAVGIVQIVAAFRVHGSGQMIMHVLVGVLDLVVGVMIVGHPVAGALLVTLFIAAAFIVGGVVRTVAALTHRHPHYGFAAASAIVSVVLGVLLWAQWPISGLWFLGVCIGINLVFLGASWIALAMRLPRDADGTTPRIAAL